MTMTTTRRAVLAGAAVIPALSLPALAGATPGDGELIALGAELKRRIDTSHRLWAEQDVLRPRQERERRRLEAARPDESVWRINDLVGKTPAGRRHHAMWKEYSSASSDAWRIAAQITNMRPDTARGVAVYALAVAFCALGPDNELDPDLALVLRAAAGVGGLTLPPSLANTVAEAEPMEFFEPGD